MRSFALLLVASILAPLPSLADTNHRSTYAGEEQREIKNFSSEDIKELLAGGGWGFAKAAELNGLPGPAHLLEMRDEIRLSKTQVRQIKAIHSRMQSAAKKLGRQLIELERDLDKRFKAADISEAQLKASLSEIGDIRSALRFEHLSAHLQTPDVLTSDQIKQYNALRGYAENSDPCAQIPKGHNAAMWRKHNGCEE